MHQVFISNNLVSRRNVAGKKKGKNRSWKANKMFMDGRCCHEGASFFERSVEADYFHHVLLNFLNSPTCRRPDGTHCNDINLIFMFPFYFLVVSDACDGYSLSSSHKTSTKATRRREAGPRTALLIAEHRKWWNSFATWIHTTETSTPVWKAQHPWHKSKRRTELSALQ